ncbi:MAG: SGNH/GDSL hydrolase family protein [Planctomycetes bacterium]|nr:SGNH/GDSL hydrolase family protein [Planctomycetota bacterium]
MKRRSLARRIGALLLGLLAAALLAELALRIHNPVPMRLRGKDLVLPTNATTRLTNPGVPGLDPVIVVQRNGLGLRGEEPPPPDADRLRIFTVGGSTTECLMLGEGRTWSDLLARALERELDGCWLNNAGLDGHSTFGHMHMIEQILAEQRPDYLVFLVGINDVDRDDANEFDLRVRRQQQPWWRRLVTASELLSTVQTLHRVARAKDFGVGHIWNLDLTKAARVVESPQQVDDAIRRQQDICLPRYRERLVQLVSMTRACGAEPVFVTQPALWSEGVDAHTGVAIGPAEAGHRSAALSARLLELFNQELRDVARQQRVFLVELAAQMPTDTRLYYDWMHYTIAGAERVAAIVGEQLIPHLVARHPERRRRR